jgi:hypothetical protein
MLVMVSWTNYLVGQVREIVARLAGQKFLKMNVRRCKRRV